MPIQPEHRWLYPIDWPELSRLIRFGRAKGRCEHCQRPHGHRVIHLGDGRWWDADRRRWRDGRGKVLRASADGSAATMRTTRVVLACAHLNHDPSDNAPRNLAALCQRCHMLHDAGEHRRRRWLNAYRRRALGDLFDRPGWPASASYLVELMQLQSREQLVRARVAGSLRGRTLHMGAPGGVVAPALHEHQRIGFLPVLAEDAD